MSVIVLAYVLPGFALLGGVAAVRPASAGARSDALNLLSVAHALLYLVLTGVVLWQRSRLPLYFFNQYLFIDSLAIYETAIASTVFLLSAVYARGYVRGLLEAGELAPNSLKLFYGGYNLLLTTVVLAFFSNNLALFWIFLELTTILSAVLIVTLNAKENIVAALKYLFIASTAMLFSIVGLIILFAVSMQVSGAGTLNWDQLMAQAKDFPPEFFNFAFIFIFIGFAAKAGIVPFHTWLPQAHAKAPSVISTLLSAVLLNAGIYGILRLYAIAHQTAMLPTASRLLLIFGILTIGVAAFSMLPRSNLKKLIAFSSIEHMGLALIGLAAGTPLVLFWVLFHALAHSLIKSLLFFCAGIMHRQYDSNKVEDMHDVLALQPLASFGLIAGSIAILGVPLSPIFLSKLNILIGLNSQSRPALLAILLLLVLVAAAFAIIFIRLFSRIAPDAARRKYAAPWSMRLPIIGLLAATLALGVYVPNGFAGMLNDIVLALGF